MVFAIVLVRLFLLEVAVDVRKEVIWSKINVQIAEPSATDVKTIVETVYNGSGLLFFR